MAIFSNEPRYLWGVLGFYTDVRVGRRIVQVGMVLTVLAMGLAMAGWFSMEGRGRGVQAVFLVVCAWLVVCGGMRLFLTGGMWVFTRICEGLEEAFPSAAGWFQFLVRAYWISLEIFLSLAFLGTLVAAVLAGSGVVSMDD